MELERRPRGRRHAGARVRGLEEGEFEGFEQNSDRIQLISGQDPSGCCVVDG